MLTPMKTDVMFSAGEAYERFMGRWSRRLAPILVRFAGVRGAEEVLDVGSGTGALSAAVSAFAPSTRVIGIDPSPSFVIFARGRYPDKRLRFEVGNAEQLRFGDGTFNRALSLLALNFVPHPARAVAEMIRVTAPGGALAAAVWDYAQGMEMLRAFWDETVALRPDSEPRDERHMPLCRCGELSALWRAHGLCDVVDEALVIETRFSSFDDYWLPFLARQGPAGAYVASLTPDEREQLRLRLRQRLSGGRQDGPIVLAARAWAVRGTVGPDKR